MADVILVLNAGSSSIKCALYDARDPRDALGRAQIDRIGAAPAYRSPTSPEAPTPPEAGATHRDLLGWLIERLSQEHPGLRIAAAGHRVVHGGREFAGPARIGPEVMARIRALAPLAPAHQPHNIAGIETLEAMRPGLPQVACFDTAFHRTQPRLAQLYALPRALADEGVLRYGFHGLSYEHVASVLPGLLGARAEGRVIVAHLGAGASMCAMRGRRSVAATMGFTALEGLVMGRRCGDLDPGVVLHLIRDRGMSAAEAEELLTRRSGLFGVSGISADMRDLMASDAPEARDAVDLFVHRAVRAVGSLAAALGGLDALVFTGGIGEHAAPVREAILEGCAWLGVRPDPARNAAGGPWISAAESPVAALVVAADEEGVIARRTAETLASGSG